MSISFYFPLETWLDLFILDVNSDLFYHSCYCRGNPLVNEVILKLYSIICLLQIFLLASTHLANVHFFLCRLLCLLDLNISINTPSRRSGPIIISLPLSKSLSCALTEGSSDALAPSCILATIDTLLLIFFCYLLSLLTYLLGTTTLLNSPLKLEGCSSSEAEEELMN